MFSATEMQTRIEDQAFPPESCDDIRGILATPPSKFFPLSRLENIETQPSHTWSACVPFDQTSPGRFRC
jgi:hypothetical protein